jgi:hypothetical protein
MPFLGGLGCLAVAAIVSDEGLKGMKRKEGESKVEAGGKATEVL